MPTNDEETTMTTNTGLSPILQTALQLEGTRRDERNSVTKLDPGGPPSLPQVQYIFVGKWDKLGIFEEAGIDPGFSVEPEGRHVAAAVDHVAGWANPPKKIEQAVEKTAKKFAAFEAAVASGLTAAGAGEIISRWETIKNRGTMSPTGKGLSLLAVVNKFLPNARLNRREEPSIVVPALRSGGNGGNGGNGGGGNDGSPAAAMIAAAIASGATPEQLAAIIAALK